MKPIEPYQPKHKVRIVTAASLFDGHDAAINVMRRIIQSTGCEVIHLGHDRSVEEVVDAAVQEDAQAIAMTSYQGGHIEYFKAACSLGLPLLCNVASDRYVRTKHRPLLPEDQRAAIVDAIRFITYTHINQFDTETILRELQPRYYVKGSDWRGRLPPDQVTICANHGIEVVYLDTVLDSSSRILQQFTQEQ